MTATLYGHRDFVQTTCPGNRYQEWVPDIRGLITPPEEGDMITADELAELLKSDRFAYLIRNLAGLEDVFGRSADKAIGAAVANHLTNVPHGAAPAQTVITLADVKDEIDKAGVRAKR